MRLPVPLSIAGHETLHVLADGLARPDCKNGNGSPKTAASAPMCWMIVCPLRVQAIGASSDATHTTMVR